MRARHFVASLAALLAASAAPAQGRPRVSLDATVGLGTGRGGEYESGSRTGIAADLLLAIAGPRARDGGALIWALGAGLQTYVGQNDLCQLTSDGGCAPDFGPFFPYSALVGWAEPGGVARVFAGSALVQVADGGGNAFGVQTRADFGAPGESAGFALVVRATVLPRYRGATVLLLSGTVGVRFR